MAKLTKKKPAAKPKPAGAAKIKPPKIKPSKVKPLKVKPIKVKLGDKKKKLQAPQVLPPPPLSLGGSAAVLDRLWTVVISRRDADPNVSHSARLLSRGTAKVAQKFGEEAVECLIEAVGGSQAGMVAESADVLYHLIVMWVSAGIRPEQVWTELQRREGVSGIVEKASRAVVAPLARQLGTRKIP